MTWPASDTPVSPWDEGAGLGRLALARGDFPRWADDLAPFAEGGAVGRAPQPGASEAIPVGARDAAERLAAARTAGRPALLFAPGPLAWPTPTPAGRALAFSFERKAGGLARAARDPRANDPATRARAEAALALMRAERLSVASGWPAGPAPRPGRALLVDEEAAAFAAAGVDPATMFAEARAAHADADIAVLACEEQMRSGAAGPLAEAARRAGVALIDWPLDPWTALEPFDAVHVAASSRGWEALALGKRLICHGAPPYAGLGLSEDRNVAGGAPVDFPALVAARLFALTRYVDPWSGAPIPFETAAARIIEIARRQSEFAAPLRCYGMAGWKRDTIRRFLAASPRPPSFRPARTLRWREGASPADAVWAAKIDPAALADAPGRRPLLIEDGFVRSVGLGAAGTPPLSLCFDRRGLYCDATRASDLERILSTAEFPPALLARAAAARARTVAAGLSKYNVGTAGAADFAAGGRRIVLVPGQVENDLSLKLGGGAVRSNLALLEAARGAAPDAFLVYKPHPDVVQGFRRGAVGRAAALRFADAIVDDVSISALIERVDSVATMTSLAGFEALLRGKRVATFGLPFYAGWGLTADAVPCPRRARKLTLDQLVAGALILYPRYLHPRSGYMCELEAILDHLGGSVAGAPLRRPAGPLRRLGWRLRGLVVPHFA